MPLVAHSDLPSFARLRAEGQEVLAPGRARAQDIRELHIGFLNMMPDAALQATERQFLRLVGACNRIAQFYVHPFTFDEIPRADDARAHIDAHYSRFEDLARDGLDALIISGANPALDDITREPFWRPLAEVVDWAAEHVCSVFCSCLATHAIVQLRYGFARYKLPAKRWGVYSHRVVAQHPHPLTAGINTRFDAPHSHVFEVNAAQFHAAGLPVLAIGEESDLHLGLSPDGFRFVFFQGHPEYDAVSLLKEYRREVGRFIDGTRDDYPPSPAHYFNADATRLLSDYKNRALKGDAPAFPEVQVMQHIDNTWTDTGKALTNNWLGLIYQLAHPKRGRGFMPGVDPERPLG